MKVERAPTLAERRVCRSMCEGASNRGGRWRTRIRRRVGRSGASVPQLVSGNLHRSRQLGADDVLHVASCRRASGSISGGGSYGRCQRRVQATVAGNSLWSGREQSYFERWRSRVRDSAVQDSTDARPGGDDRACRGVRRCLLFEWVLCYMSSGRMSGGWRCSETFEALEWPLRRCRCASVDAGGSIAGVGFVDGNLSAATH